MVYLNAITEATEFM